MSTDNNISNDFNYNSSKQIVFGGNPNDKYGNLSIFPFFSICFLYILINSDESATISQQVCKGRRPRVNSEDNSALFESANDSRPKRKEAKVHPIRKKHHSSRMSSYPRLKVILATLTFTFSIFCIIVIYIFSIKLSY
jgi:hypothetical protein